MGYHLRAACKRIDLVSEADLLDRIESRLEVKARHESPDDKQRECQQEKVPPGGRPVGNQGRDKQQRSDWGTVLQQPLLS